MPAESIHRVEELPTFHDLTSCRDRVVSPKDVRSGWARLTSRERQVMHLIVRGSTSREMAERLGISARTIEVHRAHIMLKTGTKRVPELVRWALSSAPKKFLKGSASHHR